jgi:hypothetical protein
VPLDVCLILTFSGQQSQNSCLKKKDELSNIFANSGKYQEANHPLEMGDSIINKSLAFSNA